MDHIDFQIAAFLDNNEKKSFIEIAQLLGINEKTVRNRVSHLVENGIIEHSVLLDTEEFPEVYLAFSAIHGDPDIDLKKISEHPAVLFVTTVTGKYEAMAVIVIKTRKDLSQFNREIASIRGVERSETFMIIDNIGLKVPAKKFYALMCQDKTKCVQENQG